MLNNEGIPNLASKLKSNKIWHPFLPKQLSQIGYIIYFANFEFFFGQKGVKCYLIWILRPNLESSHHLASLGPPSQPLPLTLFQDVCTWWTLNNRYLVRNSSVEHCDFSPLKCISVDISVPKHCLKPKLSLVPLVYPCRSYCVKTWPAGCPLLGEICSVAGLRITAEIRTQHAAAEQPPDWRTYYLLYVFAQSVCAVFTSE